MALIAAMALQAGQFELVVRFPGNGMGYNHVYRNLAACSRARAAIIAGYQEQQREEADRIRDSGNGVLVPGPLPTAICVPL